ncbi:MAG: MFS transporter [Campylobacteraceae bacterium]|jgi:YNFM family putative membrane transporter|nr:MFS transporter [Campylobacteraceae bacterium]
MKKQNAILYLCTILVLCTLYAAQPIQPLFKDEFALNSFQAVIFTTVIMFPLGIAPLFYGYILENWSSRQMLRVSLLLLGILEISFSLSGSYIVLIGIRAAQGFLIPAALTSLVSYISTSSTHENIQRALGNYVAITIMGGFLGRLLSGISSEYFGWRPFFFIIGCGLVLLFFALLGVNKDAKAGFTKITKKEVANVFKIKHNFFIYAAIFCVFFVFQGLLNFLPFELKSINENLGESKVGLMYAGYVIGLITALNVTKIIRFFKSESKAMIWGMFIYIAGLQLFHIESFAVMFASMFVFCLGMFMVHSIAAGFVNKLAHERKSITNGLYLSFYYAGGTFGSFLPGVFYQHFGWNAFLFVLGFALLCGVVFLILLANTLKDKI